VVRSCSGSELNGQAWEAVGERFRCAGAPNATVSGSPRPTHAGTMRLMQPLPAPCPADLIPDITGLEAFNAAHKAARQQRAVFIAIERLGPHRTVKADALTAPQHAIDATVYDAVRTAVTHLIRLLPRDPPRRLRRARLLRGVRRRERTQGPRTRRCTPRGPLRTPRTTGPCYAGDPDLKAVPSRQPQMSSARAAFGPNTDDIRDSPALAVARKLHELSAEVTVTAPRPWTPPARHTPTSTTSTTPSLPSRTPICCCTSPSGRRSPTSTRTASPSAPPSLMSSTAATP
jgi:hypothetical protein